MIHLSTTIFNELTSTYYDDTDYSFEILLQKYTSSSGNKIYNPDIIKEWKANTDKASYEYNLHKGVVKNYLNKELDRCMN